MGFDDFEVGQVFTSSFSMTAGDLKNYLAFSHTRNILHEDPELAVREGIRGMLLPGRLVISRAEGEMTRLPVFSDCVMLLYGMDGDPGWGGRQTRFLGELYAGDPLDAKYTIASKKEEKGYGILRVDYEMSRGGKLVIVSKGNLYRIKK